MYGIGFLRHVCRQKSEALCPCFQLFNFGERAFILSLVCQSWAGDCMFKICPPFDTGQGVKKVCQTWHRGLSQQL